MLIVLYEEDGLTLSQIGSKLMLDSGTLTPLLKRLEAMNLVQRARGTEDERTMHITLTGKGLSLRKSLVDVANGVDYRLRMSRDEILSVRGVVMSLIDRLAKDDVANVSPGNLAGTSYGS